MSDIGFYGLEAFVVGLAMLLVAALAFLVELVRRRRRKRDRPLDAAFFAPLIYGGLALLVLVVAEEGSLAWQRRMDDVAWLLAGGGLLLWGGVLFGLRMRRKE